MTKQPDMRDAMDLDEAAGAEALRCLERADGDEKYAKWLGEQIKLRWRNLDPTDHFVIYFIGFHIPYALTNPGGRIERELKKCGLLDPDFVKSLNLDFSGMGRDDGIGPN
jgi:hypothetical protein